jgi:hypothetical protein
VWNMFSGKLKNTHWRHGILKIINLNLILENGGVGSKFMGHYWGPGKSSNYHQIILSLCIANHIKSHLIKIHVSTSPQNPAIYLEENHPIVDVISLIFCEDKKKHTSFIKLLMSRMMNSFHNNNCHRLLEIN